MTEGWFEIPGLQKGVRTLKQQIQGLQLIRDTIKGNSVLDLGCAEGLVMKYLLDHGAQHCDGVEILEERCAVGRALLAGYSARFFAADLEYLDVLVATKKLPLHTQYDAVLALSIAHKFGMPERFIQACGRLSRRWLALRLPEVVIRDARSNHRSIDVAGLLPQFDLRMNDASGAGERMLVFERR